jgi:mannose-6-phosphate isomerase-like protein (cupin superfamily)
MRDVAPILSAIQALEVNLKQKLSIAITVFLLVAGLRGQRQPSYVSFASDRARMQSAQTTGDSRHTDALATNDASVAKPIFVPPDGNRSAEPTGDVRIKVSGADTGGAVAVLEVRTDPDFGTPVHVHHVENEWFYAIEGEYEVKVGDDIFHLKPGGSVYAPKLVPHAISDVSEKGGKMIVVAQPAGHIEAFSVDLFKVISSSTHDEAAIKAVFLKHDMDIVGPQLPKKHQTR